MPKQTSLPNFLDFDLTKVVADYSKVLGDLKVPGVDVDALVAAQKKNLDALTQANRLAFEGMQALMKRQGEIMRQAVEEASALGARFDSNVSPNERLAKSTELAKETFERALTNVRELSEMLTKSQNDVADLLSNRFSQSLDELKVAIEKAPASPFPMPGLDKVVPMAKAAAKKSAE